MSSTGTALKVARMGGTGPEVKQPSIVHAENERQKVAVAMFVVPIILMGLSLIMNVFQ